MILETGKREKLKNHIKEKIEGLKENIKSYQLLTQKKSIILMRTGTALLRVLNQTDAMRMLLAMW